MRNVVADRARLLRRLQAVGVRPHRLVVAPLVVLSVVAAIVPLAQPFLYGRIFDRLVDGEGFGAIWVLLVGLVAAGLIAAGLTVLVARSSSAPIWR